MLVQAPIFIGFFSSLTSLAKAKVRQKQCYPVPVTLQACVTCLSLTGLAEARLAQQSQDALQHAKKRSSWCVHETQLCCTLAGSSASLTSLAEA